MGIGNLIRGVQAMWNGQDSKTAPSSYRQETEEKRLQDYDLAVSMLYGRQLEVLKRDIQKAYPKDYSQLLLQPMTYNITRKIVEKLATMYNEAPEITGKNCERWLAALDWGAWAYLRQGDMLSEVCGQCPVGAEYNPATKTLSPVVLSPDQVEYEFDRMGTGKLVKMTITTWVEDERGKLSPVRTVWTPEAFHIYMGDSKDDVAEKVFTEAGKPYSGPENPFGRVPFSIMRPGINLCGDPLGHIREDLILANRTINQKLTEIQLLSKNQAHSLLVFNGMPLKDGDTVDIGVGSAIQFPDSFEGKGGSVEYISPSPRIQELWDGIVKQVQYVAFLHHVGGSWTLEGQQAASGRAMEIRNADLSEYREGKEDTHRLFWTDYADVLERTLAANENRNPLPQADVYVDFCDQDVYEDPAEERAEWEWKLKVGAASPVDVYIGVNGEPEAETPEASRAIAARLVAENLAALRNSAPPPSASPSTKFLPPPV